MILRSTGYERSSRGFQWFTTASGDIEDILEPNTWFTEADEVSVSG